MGARDLAMPRRSTAALVATALLIAFASTAEDETVAMEIPPRVRDFLVTVVKQLFAQEYRNECQHGGNSLAESQEIETAVISALRRAPGGLPLLGDTLGATTSLSPAARSMIRKMATPIVRAVVRTKCGQPSGSAAGQKRKVDKKAKKAKKKVDRATARKKKAVNKKSKQKEKAVTKRAKAAKKKLTKKKTAGRSSRRMTKKKGEKTKKKAKKKGRVPPETRDSKKQSKEINSETAATSAAGKCDRCWSRAKLPHTFTDKSFSCQNSSRLSALSKKSYPKQTLDATSRVGTCRKGPLVEGCLDGVMVKVRCGCTSNVAWRFGRKRPTAAAQSRGLPQVVSAPDTGTDGGYSLWYRACEYFKQGKKLPQQCETKATKAMKATDVSPTHGDTESHCKCYNGLALIKHKENVGLRMYCLGKKSMHRKFRAYVARRVKVAEQLACKGVHWHNPNVKNNLGNSQEFNHGARHHNQGSRHNYGNRYRQNNYGNHGARGHSRMSQHSNRGNSRARGHNGMPHHNHGNHGARGHNGMPHHNHGNR